MLPGGPPGCLRRLAEAGSQAGFPSLDAALDLHVADAGSGAAGNSGPLALAAFAVTTFMLSMINVGLVNGCTCHWMSTRPSSAHPAAGRQGGWPA